MGDLKACLVCFTTDVKLTSMDDKQLREQYNLLTGLQLKKCNGMPEYLCYQCRGYVTKFIKFRDKCHKAYFTLVQLFQKNKEITKERLEAVDRHSLNIKPFLSYLNRTNIYHEQHHSKDVKIILHDCTSSMHTLNPQDISDGSLKREDKSEDEDKSILIVHNSSNDEEINAQSSSFNESNTEAFVFDSVDDDNCLESDDNAIAVKNGEQHLDKSREDDSSVQDTEYATMLALSEKEAQAAQAILNVFSTYGNHKCNVCNKHFYTEDRLKGHLSGHDRLPRYADSWCNICNYNYKSRNLLKTHTEEKHMYKYLCKKCPEVSFDKPAAKQHYIRYHITIDNAKSRYIERPSWLKPKRMPRKGVSRDLKTSPKRKLAKLPADIKYTPVPQEEQYARVQDRKNTRNYLESRFKCDLCFKGFKDVDAYKNHMKKHDPAISGAYQCDMCKLYVKNNLKMYHHMTSVHTFKFSCQLCDYVCSSRGQAVSHYKFHKNVKYKCPHCPLEFKQMMTRQTHLRRWHPSTFICNLCGNSFVSENGLVCHKRISHTPEEVEANSQAPVDKTSKLYCADCDILFASDAAFETHLGSSKKHVDVNVAALEQMRGAQRRGRGSRRATQSEILNIGIPTATNCEICNITLANDTQARKHYSTEHPGKEYLKRYMCDVCGHTTQQYFNLKLHMRTHTKERPFKCPVCDRRFAQPSARNNHLVVHTGERRYECHICHKRFGQKGTMTLHIQTVHMKIPYAPWDKKNRKERKELAALSCS